MDVEQNRKCLHYLIGFQCIIEKNYQKIGCKREG